MLGANAQASAKVELEPTVQTESMPVIKLSFSPLSMPARSISLPTVEREETVGDGGPAGAGAKGGNGGRGGDGAGCYCARAGIGEGGSGGAAGTGGRGRPDDRDECIVQLYADYPMIGGARGEGVVVGGGSAGMAGN